MRSSDTDSSTHIAPPQSLRGYRFSSLPRDITAGIIVAALTIPVAMGYAQVAGLPAAYGLYASILPTAVYALVTSSRRIVFSMDSAASAATGGVVAAAGIALGSPDALRLVPELTLVASAFLILFALVRAGRLMSHVPVPVMHGFIAGISCAVIIYQIPLLIGTSVQIGDSFFANVGNIFASMPSFNPLSLLLSAIALAAILFAQRRAPKVPTSLILLAIATIATAALHLDTLGVSVLGPVSGGLPIPSLPDFSQLNIPAALGYGFVLALVVAVESLLALDTFAMRDGRRANENRELVSFGIANSVSALMGCAPCSASISRTAAGEAAGGSTQVVSLVAAATVAVAVIFLSPYLYYLPKPVLGAIVAAALIEVIDFKKIRRYARHMRVEFAVFLVVALTVMAYGALVGVALGVAISFIELIYRTRRGSQMSFLGVTPNKAGYQLLNEEAEAKPVSGVTICRLQGKLSFVNANAHVDELSEQAGQDVKTIIVDITQVSWLDTTATDRIVQALDMFHARDIEVRLVRSVAPAYDDYTRFEIEHIMKKVRVFPSIDAALEDLPAADEKLVDQPAT